MSSKYKFSDQEAVYFVTATTVNWLDVFTRNLYKDILLDSFRFCQNNQGLQILSLAQELCSRQRALAFLCLSIVQVKVMY
jgi:hypothetical protein